MSKLLRNRISTIKGDFDVEYQNASDFSHLPLEKCTQAYGICYYRETIVLCKNVRGHFILPGGTVEQGEALEETLIREVKEESNMRVLSSMPIGYQKVWNETTDSFFQVRYYARVEPYGPFVSDPAGHIEGIVLVSEKEAVEMLDWGEVGDELFKQARFAHAKAG